MRQWHLPHTRCNGASIFIISWMFQQIYSTPNIIYLTQEYRYQCAYKDRMKVRYSLLGCDILWIDNWYQHVENEDNRLASNVGIRLPVHGVLSENVLHFEAVTCQVSWKRLFISRAFFLIFPSVRVSIYSRRYQGGYNFTPWHFTAYLFCFIKKGVETSVEWCLQFLGGSCHFRRLSL